MAYVRQFQINFFKEVPVSLVYKQYLKLLLETNIIKYYWIISRVKIKVTGRDDWASVFAKRWLFCF
jgi:hypothetical protein